jgi:MFS family permease
MISNDTATAPSEAGPTNRSALFIVFVVVFIDLLGFGIVLPLLPRYGDTYVAELIPGGKEARAGGAILGLLMSSFSLMQFIFAPMWGRVSDRIGRRPILLLGLGGSVVFYALFGFASGLPAESSATLAIVLLFVARLGAGIAGATISTAQAVIADCTPTEKRKHGMALIGAAFGIGFTFGPLFGYAAMEFSPGLLGATGYAASGLSLLALILGAILLPETRRSDGRPAIERARPGVGALREALFSKAIGPVILCFFLATLGFGGFETTLALLLRDALGMRESDSFLIFAFVGLILLLTQGVLYRRLAKRLSEVTFMTLGVLLMGAGVAALGVVNWLAMGGTMSFNSILAPFLVAIALAVIGFAFLTPAAQALVSRRTPADRQGEILGVNQSASAMSRILGPIFGLSLYKLTSDHMLPYLFGTLLLLVMLPLLPRIRRESAA